LKGDKYIGEVDPAMDKGNPSNGGFPIGVVK
jgi:hypothetical protein